MAKKVQFTTNQPSATTDYLAADNTWKTMSGGGGGVPYTGATSNVDLGEYGLSAGFIEFDTTPTGTPATQGTMYWDTNHNTVQLIMNGHTGQVMQDTFYFCKNQSGSTIAKGTVVRSNGTLGASGRIKIVPFLANGTYPSEYMMGVTAEDISNGADGMVMHFGQLRSLNTSSFVDGDILYASPTTAGAFTTTPPTAPNNIVEVAIVIHAAVNGIIQVRPTIGSNINKDEGVKITSVANNDILKYNSTSGLWENSNALSTKQDTITGAASTVTTSNLTPSRVVVANGGGKLDVAVTTTTEIGYVNGVTSNIQTQLNAKQGTITLTTTGTSGSATLVGSTLNVPQYAGAGSGTSTWGFQLGNIIAASTTSWIGIGMTAGSNEGTCTYIIPAACTLSDMYAYHYSTNQPASGSQVFTVRKNGVDTALVITIAAGAAVTTTPYSNTANSVSFAVADKLSIRRVNNATGTGGAVSGLSFKMVI